MTARFFLTHIANILCTLDLTRANTVQGAHYYNVEVVVVGGWNHTINYYYYYFKVL